MPISAEQVRELAARGEGTTLDFKRDDYDWDDGATNSEYAKDLMAMGNTLGPNSHPAYVLVGVDNDGTIVGIAAHRDDAELHQRVQLRLNRTPRFVYYAVEVDGLSVGVHEIQPGGRPFFPLRDQPPLRRHVAMYRNGTTTDVASPTMIQEWGREDDPEAHRLRALELRRHEADAQIHANARHVSFNAHQGIAVRVLVENFGRSGFWVHRFDWEVEWQEPFRKSLHEINRPFPDGYIAPSGQLHLPEEVFIPAQGRREFPFAWSRAEVTAHFQPYELPVVDISTNWGLFRFSVHCRGEIANEITVDPETTDHARLALQRMLDL